MKAGLGVTQDARQGHTFEDEDDDEDENDYDSRGAHAQADPINIPAMNTSTPPRTTWKIADSKGVSMK